MGTFRGKRVTVAKYSDPGTILATFNDITAMPVGATDFICDVMDGWSDTADLNAVISSTYGVDGQIPADKFYANARHITFAGAVEGTNEATADSLDSFVRTVFPRNEYLIITRYDNIPKFVVCLVEGPRKSTRGQQDTRTGFRYTIPLVCPDPLKYGSDLLSSSAGVAGFSTGGFSFPLFFPLVFTTSDNGSSQVATIVNLGDGNSPPVFTIQGPLARGWFLENITTGDLLAFDVALGNTDKLVIDCLNQVAYMNGSDLVTSFITGSFFKLQPGTNQLKLFGAYNTFAGFTVQAYSAWE